MKSRRIMTEFCQHQRATNRAAATIDWQEFVLKRFFRWCNNKGIQSLDQIDRPAMLQYQHYVSQITNRKGNNYDPRTQNTHITAVRRLFQYLLTCNEVSRNPAADIRLNRKPKTLPKNIMSEREVTAVLDQPDLRKWTGVRDRAMLEVLYSTGMRRTELLKLDINDLQPDPKTILIRQGKNSRDRVVPCGRIAWKWLSYYLKKIRPQRMPDPNDHSVFLSTKGGRLGKQGLKMALDGYAKMAGITKPVTPHGFRHSCATHMSANGAGISQIQALLGHASADTTAIYVHIALSHLKVVHAKYHPREAKKRKRRKS